MLLLQIFSLLVSFSREREAWHLGYSTKQFPYENQIINITVVVLCRFHLLFEFDATAIEVSSNHAAGFEDRECSNRLLAPRFRVEIELIFWNAIFLIPRIFHHCQYIPGAFPSTDEA
jgi:hypothetical protein